MALSALHGSGVDCAAAGDKRRSTQLWNRRIGTAPLNQWLGEAELAIRRRWRGGAASA